MSEFEYKGRRYSIGVMPVYEQGPIARKLGVIIPVIVKIFMDDARVMAALKGAVSAAGSDQPVTIGAEEALALFTANFQNIADAIRAIPEEDDRFIMERCLRVVSYQPPGSLGWQPIWNKAADRLQYAELEEDLLGVYWICYQVLREKLGSFIVALLQSLAGGQ